MVAESGTDRAGARRRAYTIYVDLQWSLYRLPTDHPARSALAEATALADAYWRRMMTVGGASPHLQGDGEGPRRSGGRSTISNQ